MNKPLFAALLSLLFLVTSPALPRVTMSMQDVDWDNILPDEDVTSPSGNLEEVMYFDAGHGFLMSTTRRTATLRSIIGIFARHL